jgi:hypothetical protein
VRTRVISFVLAALAGLAVMGCGNSRTPAPQPSTSAAPGPLRSVSYPAYGLRISEPRNWLVSGGRAPLVATISLSTAVVALWKYPRHVPAPAGAASLAQARQDLIAAAKRRDPSLQMIRSTVAKLNGFPAVELDAFEHAAGQARRVRSTHVFTPEAEVVLDEYAPPAAFHAIDHAVFSPLKRSLQITPVTSG